MKIFIGTDHAGYEMKEELKTYLGDLGHDIFDKGAFELVLKVMKELKKRGYSARPTLTWREIND